VKVHVVDPPAYTPPYDHGLCVGLAAAGVDVALYTGPFRHGDLPKPIGYERHEAFYRRGRSRAARAGLHVPDMLRYRRTALEADVVHFQWLTIPELDAHLLPRRRPLIFTAHDILPRERLAGSHSAQRRLLSRFDAVIAHSNHGRDRLIAEAGLDPARVHVIPHGVFTHLAELPPGPLPPELPPTDRPVVLDFGLIRPYKGLDVLLEAWKGVEDAELWVIGRPRYDISDMQAQAPPSVHFVTRFVTDLELAAAFRRADLVVLPYKESEQSGVLATALAFAKPILATQVGGFPELADCLDLVPPNDPSALTTAITRLLADESARKVLEAAASGRANGTLAWTAVAQQTQALYAATTLAR
jgi:glycosyltransferase involved in cell wall biosynthesis